MATEQVVEHVAGGFEEAAQVTRQLDMGRISFGLGGLGVGLAFGFYVGYKFNRAKIRAEVLKEAQEEIDQVRLFYHEKYESAAPKPPLEEVIEERAQQIKDEEEIKKQVNEPERATKPPVPVQYPKKREEPKSSLDDWNYNREIAQRSRHHPYIIHQNEFHEQFPDYNQLTWTYYAGDDILVDEHDEVVTAVDNTVGVENLKRFGHGSDDENVVFVRNDRLEIEWEICRSWKTHAEEVLGLDPDEIDNPT